MPTFASPSALASVVAIATLITKLINLAVVSLLKAAYVSSFKPDNDTFILISFHEGSGKKVIHAWLLGDEFARGLPEGLAEVDWAFFILDND